MMQAPGRFLIHHETIKTINMYSSLGRNKNSIVMRINENDPNAQKTFQNLPADNESVKVCLPSRPFLLTSKSGSREGWEGGSSYRGRGRNTLDTSPVHHQTHTHNLSLKQMWCQLAPRATCARAHGQLMERTASKSQVADVRKHK